MRKIIFLLVCFIVIMSYFTYDKQNHEVNNNTEVYEFYNDSTKFHYVQKVSTIPQEINKFINKEDLLLNGIKSKNGYFCISKDKINFVCFYDLNGNLVWEKEYCFSNSEEIYYFIIVPLNNGDFLLSASSYTYQINDTWIQTNPVIAKCDTNGDIIWTYEYKDFSETAIQYVYALPNGDIITVGYTESLETKTVGIVSPSKIYLSKLSSDGSFISEKYYGGSDYDTLYHAEYVEGKGIVATINTQSTNGTFSASDDGYGDSILALIDTDLEISWFKKFNEYLYGESVSVYNNNIFILPENNFGSEYNCYKYNLNGDTIKKICLEEEQLNIISGFTKGIILQSENYLKIYNDNFNQVKKIPFDSGIVEKIIEFDEYFLILSTNLTGTMPQPLCINSVWYSSELVYSGYDYDGNLLWREAFDRTPESYKNPEIYFPSILNTFPNKTEGFFNSLF